MEEVMDTNELGLPNIIQAEPLLPPKIPVIGLSDNAQDETTAYAVNHESVPNIFNNLPPEMEEVMDTIKLGLPNIIEAEPLLPPKIPVIGLSDNAQDKTTSYAVGPQLVPNLFTNLPPSAVVNVHYNPKVTVHKHGHTSVYRDSVQTTQNVSFQNVENIDKSGGVYISGGTFHDSKINAQGSINQSSASNEGPKKLVKKKKVEIGNARQIISKEVGKEKNKIECAGRFMMDIPKNALDDKEKITIYELRCNDQTEFLEGDPRFLITKQYQCSPLELKFKKNIEISLGTLFFTKKNAEKEFFYIERSVNGENWEEFISGSIPCENEPKFITFSTNMLGWFRALSENEGLEHYNSKRQTYRCYLEEGKLHFQLKMTENSDERNSLFTIELGVEESVELTITHKDFQSYHGVHNKVSVKTDVIEITPKEHAKNKLPNGEVFTYRIKNLFTAKVVTAHFDYPNDLPKYYQNKNGTGLNQHYATHFYGKDSNARSQTSYLKDNTFKNSNALMEHASQTICKCSDQGSCSHSSPDSFFND